MADKNEMSLEDVLSSIRKMVIDDEPPVLDLTDMVKPDGTIVKVKASDSSNNQDMGAFLKLAQKNAESMSDFKRKEENEEQTQQKTADSDVSTRVVVSCDVKNDASNQKQEKSEAILELLKEIAIPLIDKWIEDNLPNLAKKAMENKLREWAKRFPVE
ncbi:MAG: hypothetical protein LBL99_03930 [Holosporaceae bacterium]|jgi:cell pole-organizing protein PopZ|nr:hypothetical protein [Holosporaceae bacterium]